MCDANKAQTIDPLLTGVELVLCDTNKAQTIDPRLTLSRTGLIIKSLRVWAADFSTVCHDTD